LKHEVNYESTSPLPGFLGDLLLRIVASVLVAAIWYGFGWTREPVATGLDCLVFLYAWEGVKSMWRKAGDW
jgi:hypothetical protein